MNEMAAYLRGNFEIFEDGTWEFEVDEKLKYPDELADLISSLIFPLKGPRKGKFTFSIEVE